MAVVEQIVAKIRKDEVRKRIKSGKADGLANMPMECLGEVAEEFLTGFFTKV